jgi:hypothetical protein
MEKMVWPVDVGKPNAGRLVPPGGQGRLLIDTHRTTQQEMPVK